MAPNEENKSTLPIHQQVILGGLARIISTTLLIPLDVFQMRYRYPDTWCVKMFRIMVSCKGGPGPYEVLTARMLQKRTFSSLRWGIYYCRYLAHKKSCALKNVNPLYQGTFLLNQRPIVMQAIERGNETAVLDYLLERRKMMERKILSVFLEGLRSELHAFFHAALSKPWTLDALQATIIASTLLHPLDVFKVRLQLYPEAWGLSLLRNMLRCEGFRAPYTGLSASILRQATYTTTRLGAYSLLYENHRRTYTSAPPLPKKLAFGVYAGVVGAMVGCPAEVILVRMMADGPKDPYRRYRNIVDAFLKIWKTEGIQNLWRGASLNVAKSVLISVSQIGTYAQARKYLIEKKRANGFLLHLYTSMLTSFITAAVTMPLDTFKTRYQNNTNTTHRDVYQKVRQEYGMLSLWRGFTPYYLRLTVHTLVTFYLLEALYQANRKKNKKNRHKED
ncbi:hypothetical protein PYW07_005392 [Mythimna separata]|uniref:Uncharacterized protein n=1 Tax=Mythimna separata TaxID=271217 RepID=A0AAD8DNP6_MYTSE|nr:hypothetical protein PYW07_005392 [Mythimna separata]